MHQHTYPSSRFSYAYGKLVTISYHTHYAEVGNEEIIEKISDPIQKISELYIQRLKTIWRDVTEQPLRLLNSRGVPIYHFVFASNNQNAVKISKQIISKS